jgi:peptide/nickel transport system substrate-binding protein
MRRAVRCLVLAIAVIAVPAACNPAADANAAGRRAEAVRRGGTVVIVSSSDLDQLNSLVSADRYTQELLRYALFLPLVRYGPDLDFEPALARDWELFGDTAIAFRLRDDVRWQDGERTSAYDVAFTFERAKDPATAFPNAEYFAHWTAVEVVDSFTVRFRMQPHAEALAGLPFMPIMPKHLLEEVPADGMARAPFNRAPVGNGPFRYVDHRANDRWIFEANPDFPSDLGQPNVDRIVWRIVPDPTSQVTELRTGAAHLALNPRPEHVAEAEADAFIRPIVRPSRQYSFVGWNLRRPPLDDVRVRRALGMAIDRQEIIETLRDGIAELAVGPIGPYHWAYDSTLAALPFSVDSARALLVAAGLADGNSDGVLELPGGEPFEISLKFLAGSGLNRDAAEMIASDLLDVGVRVRLRPTEWSTLIGDLTGEARNFDSVLMGWEADFRVNLRGILHSAERGGPFQFAGYANEEVDRLIDGAARTTDRQHAAVLLRRLQRVVQSEQPWTFLYYFPDTYLADVRLRGVETDIRGALVHVTDWWLELGTPLAQERSD